MTIPRLCECGCGRFTPVSRHNHPETRNHKRFFARVAYRRKYLYLGTFDTIEEAAVVAARKKEELRGKPASSS